MTMMLRFAVLIALSCLTFRQMADGQFTLRVGVDLVDVLFSVTDRDGRFVPGLGPEDFTIEEDGEPQEIRYFTRENELPLTLALLVDTSPSVEQVFDEEKRTASRFLETTLRPQDLSLVMGFDRSVTLMQDFTEDADRLRDAVFSLQIGTGTSIYDAVYLAAEDRLADEAGRKAIILISDGDDTTSQVSRTDALIAAHLADAIIYSISNAPRRGGTGDMRTLEALSEETGGRVFQLDRRSRFEEIFNQIAEELRTQYSLGYVSANPERDGRYREIEIIPRDRNLRVRARKGYYAPSEEGP